MLWSKLRSKVRQFICPELRDRIDFHVTSYRGSHDEAEKDWITIDGEPALTASWYQHQWYGWPRDAKGRFDPTTEYPRDIDRERNEVHRPADIGDALRSYLDMPITDTLESDNPFIRALSIVDRRTGKRTLQAMSISPQDHSLVQAFYRLRTGSSRA